MAASRIVIKVGSSSLTDESGCLSEKKLSNLTKQISYIQTFCNAQVVLVSSGAIACGRNKLGWLKRDITLAEKQAAAAVGQGVLMNMYEEMFAKEGIVIAQVLLTKADVQDSLHIRNIERTMNTLLSHSVIPIVNENDTVAVDEIRFGDNDTLSSLVARLILAHKLILLTDIDGLYTANPRQNGDAKRIDEVFEITRSMEKNASSATSSVGTGGMKTKLHAAKLAVEQGTDVVIASSSEPNVIPRILSGERIGTLFHSKRPEKAVIQAVE